MSNTGHQNTDTSETSGSSEDDTQSQTADFMIDILPPVGELNKNKYNIQLNRIAIKLY